MKMGFGKLKDRLKQARRSSEDILQIVYMHNDNFNGFHFVNALMYISQNCEEYSTEQRRELLKDKRFHILLEMSLDMLEGMSASRIVYVLESMSVLRRDLPFRDDVIWTKYLERFEIQLQDAKPNMMRRIIKSICVGKPSPEYFPLVRLMLDNVISRIPECEMSDLIDITESLCHNDEICDNFRDHTWFTDMEKGLLPYLSQSEVVDFLAPDERQCADMLIALSRAFPDFKRTNKSTPLLTYHLTSTVKNLNETMHLVLPGLHAISNAMLAMASLGLRDKELYLKMASRFKEVRTPIKGIEMYNILRACYLAGYEDQKLMDELLPRLAFLAYREKLTPSQLFECGWYLAALGQFDVADKDYLRTVFTQISQLQVAMKHSDTITTKQAYHLHLADLMLGKSREIPESFPRLPPAHRKSYIQNSAGHEASEITSRESAVAATLENLGVEFRIRHRTSEGLVVFLVHLKDTHPNRWVVLHCTENGNYFVNTKELMGEVKSRIRVLKNLHFDSIVIPFWKLAEPEFERFLRNELAGAVSLGLGENLSDSEIYRIENPESDPVSSRSNRPSNRAETEEDSDWDSDSDSD